MMPAPLVALVDPVARAEKILSRREGDASKAERELQAKRLRVSEAEEKLRIASADDAAADLSRFLKDLRAAEADLREAEETSARWAGLVGEAGARRAAAVAEARRKSLEGERARLEGEAEDQNARFSKMIGEASALFASGAATNLRLAAVARELRIVGAVTAFDPDRIEREHRLAAIRELSDGAAGRPPEAGPSWLEDRISFVHARPPVSAGVIEWKNLSSAPVQRA